MSQTKSPIPHHYAPHITLVPRGKILQDFEFYYGRLAKYRKKSFDYELDIIRAFLKWADQEFDQGTHLQQGLTLAVVAFFYRWLETQNILREDYWHTIDMMRDYANGLFQYDKLAILHHLQIGNFFTQLFPPIKEKQSVILDDDQIRKLLIHNWGHENDLPSMKVRDRLIACLMLEHGLHPHTIGSLTWNNVCIGTATLEFDRHEQLNSLHKHGVHPLGRYTRTAFLEYQVFYKPSQPLLPSQPLIILDEPKEGVSINKEIAKFVRLRPKRFAAKLGIDALSWQDVRESSMHWMARHGMTWYQVLEYYGLTALPNVCKQIPMPEWYLTEFPSELPPPKFPYR